ncbi:uncharacterized protein LOC135342948 isoform X2 [Halichondria panicea]|uniref:uncharacterized protein LOC135342948 isoform X2 n=1 Tax=Halichondria panicea TaxID=6063 RepID=UPI00312BC0F0
MSKAGDKAVPRSKVKPMLTTAQKNFRDVSHPNSIGHGLDHFEVTRENLNVPNSRCFVLHGLLTPSECAHYITETENMGYSDLSDLFPTDYRSNDRVLSICKPLVEELWRRLEPTLTRNEVFRVRPIGFGNEGTWKPFRLNECCKFGRYKAGGHFSPHIDGPWVPRENESSIFTVIIYLNSDFQGGATNFISEEKQDRVLCSVTPVVGTALIFNHDTLHEAEPVCTGTKYIVRTEIMYRRVDTEMLPNPGAYESDGNYLRTLTLYQKSLELEKSGNIQGFTDTYLEAIKLQRQAQRSISMESRGGDELNLPYEIFLDIFGYLSARDVCVAMRVCTSWYDLCMDGELWHEMYRSKWPIGIQLEGKIDWEELSLEIRDDRPFLRDWYGLYKQRVGMIHPQKVAVLDIGSFSFKCAAVHRQRSTLRTASCESVIATVPGIYDLHLRRYDYQRYFSGREAKDKFPGETVRIVEKGLVTKCQLLPEIVTRLFFDCVVRPKYTPVIFLERPGLWSDQMKREISYCFIKQFQNPGIAFLSSAVAILCSLNVSTGVVVDMGEGVATCVAVVNGKEQHFLKCDPSEATSTKLAEMVHRVVTDTRIEKAALAQNIVLTAIQPFPKPVQPQLYNALNQLKVTCVLTPG